MSDNKSHEPHQKFSAHKQKDENAFRKMKTGLTKESAAKTRGWNNKAPKRRNSK